MFNKDLPNLFAIQDSCKKIGNFTTGITPAEAFYRDEKVFDAVLMNFIVIGEAVARISPEIQMEYANIEWKKIKSFRNIVAHNYFGVDADEVWQIICSDIINLQKSVEDIIKKIEK